MIENIRSIKDWGKCCLSLYYIIDSWNASQKRDRLYHIAIFIFMDAIVVILLSKLMNLFHG